MSSQFPRPPFPEQQQSMPGKSALMDPPPDYGEETYRGAARLADKKAVITGADSGMGRALYVVSGQGVAKSGSRRLVLRAGTLLLIEHGDRHEIRNSGATLLKTLNFYIPPAYTKSGDELPGAKA